jgi:hypothetical protein
MPIWAQLTSNVSLVEESLGKPEATHRRSSGMAHQMFLARVSELCSGIL